MLRPKVLLDTNVVVSGLVFLKGNEHEILKLAEGREIMLSLPEFVIEETRAVLTHSFAGHEVLFDVFLAVVGYAVLPWREIEPLISVYRKFVRDKKDAPILASVVVAKPDFAVTGDLALREDLKRCSEVRPTKVCSSKQFLETMSRKPL